MLGLDPGGPAPTIDTWHALVLPEDHPLLDALIADVIVNPQGRDFEFEVRARHSDGRTVWIMDRGAVVERAADGSPLRVVGTHLDITARKEAEARTHWLAYFDALAGLPNRRLLLDRMRPSLSQEQRTGQMGALVFIDLDNFKHINDARGHGVGDTKLRAMGERLQAHTLAEDTEARHGGDEFVVLLGSVGPDIASSARHAMTAAEKLRKALEVPLLIDGMTYSTTGSFVITLFPNGSERSEDLLREADIAMYTAKAVGRNRAAFFEAPMQVAYEQRLTLEQDLKHALLEGRWTHPVHGAVSPARFIPIAEDTGVIVALGEFVLRQACLALQQRAGRARRAAVGERESAAVSPG